MRKAFGWAIGRKFLMKLGRMIFVEMKERRIECVSTYRGRTKHDRRRLEAVEDVHN